MLLQDAISLVCSEICLQLGPMITQATQPARLTPGKIRDTDLATWLVHDTHMFTLIKHGMGTFAYCHGNNTLFYAKPEFMLLRGMPEGHAFLAQIAEDRESAEGRPTTPRLLVMDLVAPRIEDPKARYQAMRTLDSFFPSTCVPQWAGEIQSLRNFIANGLPHEVAGVVALRGPLQIVRELRVEPPMPILQDVRCLAPILQDARCLAPALQDARCHAPNLQDTRCLTVPDGRAPDPTEAKRARRA